MKLTSDSKYRYTTTQDLTAESLDVPPKKLRDAAWIQPVKYGSGRYQNSFTHFMVVTYSFDFVRVRLPKPVDSLAGCCAVLQHFFSLDLLAVEDGDRLIIYVDRETTVTKFGLDPTDRLAFDRVALWMQERTQ